jgi:hypothetical protein
VVDYRNNVIYNWGNANACYGGEMNITGGVSQVNIVNNYYKPGPATPEDLKFIHASYQADNSKGTGEWFVGGNVMEGDKLLSKKNKLGIDLKEAGYPKGAIAKQAFFISVPLPEESAKDAYEKVLKYAGAYLPVRDAVDERIIAETKSKTASGIGMFGKPGIIDNPLVVGGWPGYAEGRVPADADNDGMPDGWETKNGLNPNDASDRNKTDASGYTMLELYLNERVQLK